MTNIFVTHIFRVVVFEVFLEMFGHRKHSLCFTLMWLFMLFIEWRSHFLKSQHKNRCLQMSIWSLQLPFQSSRQKYCIFMPYFLQSLHTNLGRDMGLCLKTNLNLSIYNPSSEIHEIFHPVKTIPGHYPTGFQRGSCNKHRQQDKIAYFSVMLPTCDTPSGIPIHIHKRNDKTI